MPAPAAPPPPPLDAATIATLKDLAGPDEPDFVASVVASFLRHLDVGLSTLEASLAGGDGTGLAKAAHSLKGAAGNVGAKPLAAACAALEAALRGGGDARAALATVVAEASRARPPLETLARGG